MQGQGSWAGVRVFRAPQGRSFTLRISKGAPRTLYQPDALVRLWGHSDPTVPGTRTFQESSHSRQNATAPGAPSPKATVTRARPVTWKRSLFLVARLGREDRPTTFVGHHQDLRSGISSLHVGFCKSDRSGSWSELTASLRGPPQVQGEYTRRRVAGQETPHRAWLPALDPAGPGAALGLWLRQHRAGCGARSLAGLCSAGPGRAECARQDAWAAEALTCTRSHPAAVWHTVLSPHKHAASRTQFPD